MIIENKINKEKMEDSIKLFCKYAMLQRKKNFKKWIIVGICCGIVLILSWWILFNKFYLIVGAIMILYNVFLIVRFINSQKKLYNKALKEELNKLYNQEFVYRKHIFDKRDLILEIDYGTKKVELKYSFDNYYKLWIEENNNVIIIQFNKKPNGQIIIIYDCNIDNFKQYCSNNNIEYITVKK